MRHVDPQHPRFAIFFECNVFRLYVNEDRLGIERLADSEAVGGVLGGLANDGFGFLRGGGVGGDKCCKELIVVWRVCDEHTAERCKEVVLKDRPVKGSVLKAFK